MSLPARVTTLVIAFLAVVAGGIYVAFNYIGAKPPTVDWAVVISVTLTWPLLATDV